MKNAALYMRVSTGDQTVENQRHRLKEYARLRGWEVIKEFSDEGISGAQERRPSLDLLLQEVRDPKRGWDIVLSYKLDRIGRSLPHLIQIIEEMKKHNVQFVLSDDPSFDTTTPHGKLMFTFFGAIAQYERELNKERQREGIKRAKREGKNCGRPRIHGGKKQKVLRLWSEGKSIRKISNETGVGRGTVERMVKGVLKGTPLNFESPAV